MHLLLSGLIFKSTPGVLGFAIVIDVHSGKIIAKRDAKPLGQQSNYQSHA